jgi:predicted TIM-barrel fold metal-dependent hydrolase
MARSFGYPFPDEALDVIDDRGALRAGGDRGSFDPKRRLRELDGDGVAGEVLEPTCPVGPAPFFDNCCARVSPELRAAGARAHNRWLAELCQEGQGRLYGVALIEPWPDMDAALSDVKRAHALGMVAIYPSQFGGLEGEDLPGYWDAYWDPLWAACADHGLVVQLHAGLGQPQGGLDDFVRMIEGRVANSTYLDGSEVTTKLGEVFDNVFCTKAKLWHLMWGGVFDRYPELRVVFAEIHSEWIRPTLTYLDRRQTRGETRMLLTPSEYWDRNCGVVASSPRVREVHERRDIGMDQLMFGTDMPHGEGTWPNTQDWIRSTFEGVPEDEAQLILGQNAIRVYQLDEDRLTSIAAQVGPRSEDVLRGPAAEPAVLDHFHLRSGYRKQYDFNELELKQSVDQLEEALAQSCH